MNKAADLIAAALGQTIAERGADYYRSGKILSVQQQSDGAGGRKWPAASGIFIGCSCAGADGAIHSFSDCPYDALCKHIAAAWYAALSGEPPELPKAPALKKAGRARQRRRWARHRHRPCLMRRAPYSAAMRARLRRSAERRFGRCGVDAAAGRCRCVV